MTFTDEQLKEIQEVFWWKCALVNSHYIERGIRAVAEHAAQLEREESCKDICGHCKDSVVVERDNWGKWWHPQGASVPARGEDYVMTCSVLCEAQKIRARGEESK